MVFLYIDPATTGQLIAVVTGVIISVSVTLGMYRTKVAAFFQKRKISRMEKKIAKEAEKKG